MLADGDPSWLIELVKKRRRRGVRTEAEAEQLLESAAALRKRKRSVDSFVAEAAQRHQICGSDELGEGARNRTVREASLVLGELVMPWSRVPAVAYKVTSSGYII